MTDRETIRDEIERRAWQLLRSREGFNGHSAAEISKWGRHDISRNSVGVAVCMARDEVWERAQTNIPPRDLEARVRAIRKVGFTKGAFREVERNIVRLLKENGARLEQAEREGVFKSQSGVRPTPTPTRKT